MAIAAALAADPAVLLLDEPTRGMDPARRAALARLIRARAATGRAIVLATHDRRFAAACGAEVHELVDGRLGGGGVTAGRADAADRRLPGAASG